MISLGIGIGLRKEHFAEIFATNPPIDWFEIISENFMEVGGAPMYHLQHILERYPVVQHGVSLAIGSPCPLNWDYLRKLKALTTITKTPWLSDHLSWGQVEGSHFHDLLPLPLTQEMLSLVVERARIIQDFLEIPFALENISSIASFQADEMPEWEFYAEVVERANISMMLDINNIYVSSRNLGFDPETYIAHLPLERVIQIHLAGHTDHGEYVLDTHDHPVSDAVWNLYAKVWPKTREASTLLEWDANFIPFEETWKEALKAKSFQQALYKSV